jgi:hypothetical protein
MRSSAAKNINWKQNMELIKTYCLIAANRTNNMGAALWGLGALAGLVLLSMPSDCTHTIYKKTARSFLHGIISYVILENKLVLIRSNIIKKILAKKFHSIQIICITVFIRNEM